MAQNPKPEVAPDEPSPPQKTLTRGEMEEWLRQFQGEGFETTVGGVYGNPSPESPLTMKPLYGKDRRMKEG